MARKQQRNTSESKANISVFWYGCISGKQSEPDL